MRKFNVGDKVKCVSPVNTLEKDKIYEIERVDSSVGGRWKLGLNIKEHGWFYAERFEPVLDTKPHKHAELIKAWADGAQIQELFDGTWRNTFYPRWHETTGYFRIKPKQDEVRYAFATVDNYAYTYWHNQQRDDHNVKATFDGETGKLKAVEILA